MNARIKRVKLLLSAVLICATSFAFADEYTYDGTQNFKITYEGSKVSDFPLLLKLDETKVPGLYTTVQNAGADLKFTSLDGGTEYPYEVDTWNPEGTSLVWVKVPSFEKDAQFQMHYGCAAKTTNPSSTEVWSGYDLVCHVNGNANDSTENAVSGALNTNAGACGREVDAMVGKGYGTTVGGKGPAIMTWLYQNIAPASSHVLDDSIFTASFWVRYNGAPTTWKRFLGLSNGWSLDVANPATDAVQMAASSGSKNTFKSAGKFIADTWLKIDAVFNDKTFSFYLNGNAVGNSVTVASGATIGYHTWLGWGGVQSGSNSTPGFDSADAIAADFDECRVYGGAADAARVAADYAVATGDYCEAVSAEAPYVSIDSLTFDLPGEYVPTTLKLTSVATLHNMDGTIVYHWDLNGDGQFDDLEGEDVSTAEVQLVKPATFTPGVKVTVDGTELVAQKVLDAPIAVRGHDVALTFEVIKSMCPGEIAFTAKMDGATGECKYSWDFNGDGEVDRVGTSATETWVCALPGKYKAKVSVLDSVGVSGEGESSEAFVVNGTFYADGDAVADGDGSQEKPFNSMRSLAGKMNDGDKAFVRGTFVVGDEKAAIAFAAGSIVIDKWGDEKPLFTSTTTTFWAADGIFVFNGENVVLSNLVFNMTKESFSKANIVRFNGDNATMGKCDFSVVGGSVRSMWGYAGGVGTSSYPIQRGLVIEDCTFNGFRDGANEVYAVTVGEDATIARCVFENVSSATRANNGSGGNFCFVSNVVLNVEGTNTTGSAAGVVVCGGWNKFSNSTIAYNRFINADANLRAGCVIYCTSKTGQNGIYAHHNTVVGYRAFASFDGTQDPWTFMFCDNLIVGSDCLFRDTATTATYATQKDGYIRNNYYMGAFRDVPEGYSFDDKKMAIDGNVALSKAPRFVKAKEPISPDFYRAKVQYKTDNLMVGGWTDGGKYPAYIGACEPFVTGGMAIYIR